MNVAQRLGQVEPWAPNYFGAVPDDYALVVEGLATPAVEAVAAYYEADPERNLDGAIAAAYRELLPAGYDGVAVDVRERPTTAAK